MSEENVQVESIQAEEPKRDSLDGGFAIVDREKIIEEETREITPWYKHFINIFIAPRKMMEENFHEDPPKGVSVGIVGSIIFLLIAVVLTYANPLMKTARFDGYRMMGIAEEMLGQKYIIEQVIAVIGGICLVFLMGLLTTVVIQVAKAIAKDKGKFGVLFTTVLLSQMVGSAITCIDRLIGMFIPTQNTVLGLPILLGEDFITTHLTLAPVVQLATLTSIASFAILVIGYSVATRTSIKKSIVVIGSVQVFFLLVGVGMAYMGQMMMQNMAGAM